jgi:DnaJ-class molecular chaperone
MKNFEDLNYYEVLGIPLDASTFEVRRAYKDSLSLYDEDSVISHSFFDDDQRGRVLKRIEQAFMTLIDDAKRADYNRMLVQKGLADASILTRGVPKKPIPLFRGQKSWDHEVSKKRIRRRLQERGTSDQVKEILSSEAISGRELKAIRKRIGITLEEIFELARIQPNVLEAIEQDQFERLPSMIYLRSFLKSYAETLQLDPRRVVDGYLKNIHRNKQNNGKRG